MDRRRLIAGCALIAVLAGCGGNPVAAGSPPVAVPNPAPTPAPTPTPTPTAADYTAFGPEVSVTVTGYIGDAMEPFISRDGQYLLFNNSNDPAAQTDLFYATRTSDNAFVAAGPIIGANGAALDAVPSLDTAGTLYFVSTRSYDASLATIYQARFAGGSVTPPQIVDGIARRQRGMLNFDAEISGDGDRLWFVDGAFSGGTIPDSATIAVAAREASGFARLADSAAILAAVNATGLNYAPSISADGRELFFTRIADPANPAPAIYRAIRRDTLAAFGAPQRVAAITDFAEAPSLSADGHILYYHKRVDGRFALFLVRR